MTIEHIHTSLGLWSAATAYVPGDGVTWGGTSYTALVASTGVAPGTSPTTWAALAMRGLPGNCYPDQTAFSATTYDGSDRPELIVWCEDVALTKPLLIENITYDGSGKRRWSDFSSGAQPQRPIPLDRRGVGARHALGAARADVLRGPLHGVRRHRRRDVRRRRSVGRDAVREQCVFHAVSK